MNENNSLLDRNCRGDKNRLTAKNRQLVENERNRIFLETGILYPRYAIVNNAVAAALGKGEEAK